MFVHGHKVLGMHNGVLVSSQARVQWCEPYSGDRHQDSHQKDYHIWPWHVVGCDKGLCGNVFGL